MFTENFTSPGPISYQIMSFFLEVTNPSLDRIAPERRVEPEPIVY